MPLISKYTNLKSLKFGVGTASDRPGGGFSSQPYIIKDIPSNNSDPSNIFNTGGPDSLLRGGLMAPIKAIDDVSRLTQMFFDTRSPNGLLFTAKTNVLSRTSVKTEASVGSGTAFGNINQGVYLPTSTIAQAGVGFLGAHGNLLGLNPASPGNNNPSYDSQVSAGGLVNYESAVLFNNSDIDYLDQNRLINLKSAIDNNWESFPINGITLNTNAGTSIMQYGGGPGSILGIGTTNIPFASERTGLMNKLARGSENQKNFFYGKSGLIGTNNPGNLYNGKSQEIDRDLTNKLTGATSQSLRPNILSNLNPGISGSGITESDLVNFDQSQLPNRVRDNQSLTGLNNPLSKTDPAFFYGKLLNGDSYNGNKSYDLEYDRKNTHAASNKYNTLVEKVSNVTPIDNEGFKFGNSFNVYQSDMFGDSLWPTTTPLQSQNNSSTYTQIEIIEEPANPGKISGNPKIKDFRKTLRDNGSTNTLLTLSQGYDGRDAIDSRVNRGNPGKKNTTNNYSLGTEALDKITASGFYTGTTPTHTGEKNDLVRLSIGILNSDGSGQSTYMHFRSFIDSFSDAYTAEWGDVQYIGRADKFYNYKGFTRSINLGWTVYAQSKPELIPMYEKLNFLASSLAPDYSSAGYMKGNLARLTVGGYLYNQLGIIKSITYDIPTESTWEIGLKATGGNDSTVEELPHMIKVTGFSFIPIEHSIPQKGSRFIHLANGTKSPHYKGSYPGTSIS